MLRVTANDQELASINRLAGNYAMVRSPSGVANRYTNLSEIGKGEDAEENDSLSDILNAVMRELFVTMPHIHRH